MNAEQTQRATSAAREFLTTPLDVATGRHSHQSAEAAVLRLFQRTAVTVPAYAAFLAEHGIDPAAIRKFSAFESLPLITKENYLRRHPLPDLCRDGRLHGCDMVAVSSGSTGEPLFWPRFLSDELAVATRFEQIFHDNFFADKRSTLAVVCFAMGTWVGGIYTLGCCRQLAAKGYPLTVVAPGNNPSEIYRVVRALGPCFEQVVLLGYPPFIKEVIDNGPAAGIDWAPLNLKLVLAGEVFSEEWRTLVSDRMGAQRMCYDSASLYGTADAGVLGTETPLSTCIRRFFAGHPDAARAVLGESRLPTLVQYDPLTRFFETVDNTLVFSADGGVPLVRYHISDHGGLLPYDDMLSALAAYGFDPRAQLRAQARAADSEARGVRALPFAWVFGRSHFTVSFFGANIYPENIAVGLQSNPVASWVTGKFVLQATENAEQQHVLSIDIELAPGVEIDTDKEAAIADAIVVQLLRLNSEFAHYVPATHQMPRIQLRHTGDPHHFPAAAKHRYTRP